MNNLYVNKKKQDIKLQKDLILMLISDLEDIKLIGKLDGIEFCKLTLHDFFELLLKAGMVSGDCIIVPQNAKLIETRKWDLTDYVFEFNGHNLVISLNLRNNEIKNYFGQMIEF